MKKTAQILSILFHPYLLPLYGGLLVVSYSFLEILPLAIKALIVGGIFLFSGVLPMLFHLTLSLFYWNKSDKKPYVRLTEILLYTGAGILLDVTTRTQVKQGTPVAWKDIRRGDLLFYTNAQRYNKTGVERIGHVALYLGENYILHTASDYAVIEQMSATRQKYFITGRRVL